MANSPPKPAPPAAMLSRTREDAKLLHQKADAMNDKIREFIKALVAQRIGVSAGVVIETDEDAPDWFRVIEFTKENNAWTLMHATGPSGNGDYDLYEELTDAPRSVRMMAIKNFPKLIEALGSAVKREIQEVEQRMGDVDRLIAELRVTGDAANDATNQPRFTPSKGATAATVLGRAAEAAEHQKEEAVIRELLNASKSVLTDAEVRDASNAVFAHIAATAKGGGK